MGNVRERGRLTRFGELVPFFARVPYNKAARTYLDRSGHYLQNAPPGCLVAVACFETGRGLFDFDIARGAIRGLLLLGRPIARAMPQDGTVAEITRLVIDDGFPKGTASALVRSSFDYAKLAGIKRVDAIHDRTRHTGCVYKKAGMRPIADIPARVHGWESRDRSASAVEAGKNPKRRWSISL